MEGLRFKEGDRLKHFMDKKIYLLKKLVHFPFLAVLEEETGKSKLFVKGRSYLQSFFNHSEL